MFRNRFLSCFLVVLLCGYFLLGCFAPAVSVGSCNGFGVVPAYASGVVVSGQFHPSDGEWKPIRRNVWTRVYDWVKGVFTDDEVDDEVPTQVIPSTLGTTEIFQLTPDTILTQASTAFIRSDSFLWLRNEDIYPTGLSNSDELFDWLPYEGSTQSTGVNLIAGYSGFASRSFDFEKLFGASGIGATVYSYYSFTTTVPVDDFRLYLRTVWENNQSTSAYKKVYPGDVTIYIQKNPDWSYELNDIDQEFYFEETKSTGLTSSDYKDEATFSTSLTQPGQYGILVVYSFDNAAPEDIAGQSATLSLSSYLIAANASPVSSGGSSAVPGPISSDVSAVSGVSYANASGDVFTGSLYDVTNGSVYNPTTNTNVIVDTWNYDSASQKYTFSTESGDIVYTFAPNYVTYTATDGFGVTSSGRLTYVADSATVEEFEKEQAANKTEQEEEQTGIIGSIGKALGDLFGGVLGAIASIFQSILSGLTGLVENIVGLLDVFTSLPASVFSFLGDILGVFPPEVVGLFSGAFALVCFVALIKFFRG